MAKLWDISPPVDADAPAFASDAAYSQRWAARIEPGCPVNVAVVTLSPHVGAHADAPLHYDPAGLPVGRLPLGPYLGHCRVIHALQGNALVGPDDLAHALADLPGRVLIRTYKTFPQRHFDPAFKALAPDTVALLAQRGVELIGIDSASVDPADSKDLPSHQMLRQHGLRVLENLCLDEVPEGDYELIALPLKWVHADASPVRAVLRSL